MKFSVLRTASLVALIALAASAHAADPRGRWITASGNLEVDVADCGAALCGTVSKVLANRSMTPTGGAAAPADGRSPQGLEVMTGFVPTDLDASANLPAEWAGTVYNRENGRSYPARMSIDGETLVLRVRAGTLMSVTQRWQRAAKAEALAGAQ